MTKKSMARQMRDREKKEMTDRLNESFKSHPIWDEVKNLSDQILTLLTSYALVGEALQVPEIYAEIKDPKSLVSAISILSADLRNVTNDVINLRKQHSDRSGAATSPEEHMAGIHIHQEYVTMIERVEGVIQPTYQELMQIIGAAEIAAREKNEKFSQQFDTVLKQAHEAMTQEPNLRPDQDPSVITDAVVIDK